jgi:hypothetical protein
MKKLLWAAALAALAALPATARADGIAFAGTENGRTGAASPVAGLTYVTLSLPNQTVVTKIGFNKSVISYRSLNGQWGIPIVAFDGSKAGVSHDGKVLVLAQPPIGQMRKISRFEVLSTRGLEPLTTVVLRGSWSFDALSPDGSTLYLIEHVNRQDVSQYRVRAYDLEANRLLPKPIRDPKTGPIMHGYPMSRATSADGRWVYTLYQAAEHSFVHALDTVNRKAACVDLPKGTPPEYVGDARLSFGPAGNLVVRSPAGGILAVIDTKTHTLRENAAAPREEPFPWPFLVGALAVAAAAATLRVRRLRPMPAVVADQRRDEPGQGDARADLEEEPILVASLNGHRQAADGDPDAGGERGEEEHDHGWVVPRAVAPSPEGVVENGRRNGDEGGQHARERLAGRRGPRRDGDDRRRQPAREHQPA